MSTKKQTTEPVEEGVQEMITKDDYLRLAADFENYKKRASEEKIEMTDIGKRMVISQILDVVDAFDSAKEQEEWTEGLELAVGKLDQMLKGHGVERIETKNKAFDPATMEAVGTVPGGDRNTVQSQQRAGWTMHGRVMRPARVIVFA